MAEHNGEKAARAAQVKAETRFAVAFDTTPAPLVIVRLSDARHMAANNGFLEALGYERDKLLTRTFYDLQPYDSTDAFERVLNTLRDGGSAQQTEMDLQGEAGQQKRVIMSAKPIELDGDACAIFTFADITELRAVQKQLEEARLRLAQMRERERLSLARELHDDAVQNLIGLSYQLAQESRKAAACGECGASFAQAFKGYQQDVLGVSQQLREVIRGLRPAGLNELGLSAAIHNYAKAFQSEKRGEMPRVQLELEDSAPRLPRDDRGAQQLALCLLRAMQEAFRNVVNHAQATEVRVRLTFREDTAHLEVTDDGRGFEVPDSFGALARDNHFGLVGTDEYVAALGGQLEVTSAPGTGTTVRVRLPLELPRFAAVRD